ncbi:hypothetical protein M0802_016359 [Mischocyttarus mexicanus]|nr:hypothetical protein M0802_016359 [Mischocyttarus mexicanus]
MKSIWQNQKTKHNKRRLNAITKEVKQEDSTLAKSATEKATEFPNYLHNTFKPNVTISSVTTPDQSLLTTGESSCSENITSTSS